MTAATDSIDRYVSPNYRTGENDDTAVFFVMEDGSSFKNEDKSWSPNRGDSLRE
jgi:hypothetical protein